MEMGDATEVEEDHGADDDDSGGTVTWRSPDLDREYVEDLLIRAGSALDLVAEVLGRRRLVQWLDDMKERFSTDIAPDRKPATSSFKRSAAAWAENHLGAQSTTIGYQANGVEAKEPYDVDIWAHFKGEGSQADLDIWIQCREAETPTTKAEIINMVEKAGDVFQAAHMGKQEFYFDRVMLVSSAPFDPEALAAAEQHGVSCIRYDGISYLFQSEGNWKLKPNWMREAELNRGRPR